MTKQSILRFVRDGLLRFARNDDLGRRPELLPRERSAINLLDP
jgi:hypothetical protein